MSGVIHLLTSRVTSADEWIPTLISVVNSMLISVVTSTSTDRLVSNDYVYVHVAMIIDSEQYY